MRRDTVGGTPYIGCWCVVLGVVLSVWGTMPAEGKDRNAQKESLPPQSSRSGHTITSNGIKVSIVGNQVFIESSTPVVVDIRSPADLQAVQPKPEKPVRRARLDWDGPIIIAPTP